MTWNKPLVKSGIIALVIDGLTSRQIAMVLGLSLHRVNKIRQMRRLLKSRLRG